jgi:hypothetical protein
MKTYYKQVKNIENYMMLDSDTSQVGGIINQIINKNISLSGNINFYNKMVIESQDVTKWVIVSEVTFNQVKNDVLNYLNNL